MRWGHPTDLEGTMIAGGILLEFPILLIVIIWINSGNLTPMDFGPTPAILNNTDHPRNMKAEQRAMIYKTEPSCIFRLHMNKISSERVRMVS